MKIMRIDIDKAEFIFNTPRPEMKLDGEGMAILRLSGGWIQQLADYARDNDFSINGKPFRAMQCAVQGAELEMVVMKL